MICRNSGTSWIIMGITLCTIWYNVSRCVDMAPECQCGPATFSWKIFWRCAWYTASFSRCFSLSTSSCRICRSSLPVKLDMNQESLKAWDRPERFDCTACCMGMSNPQPSSESKSPSRSNCSLTSWMCLFNSSASSICRSCSSRSARSEEASETSCSDLFRKQTPKTTWGNVKQHKPRASPQSV